MPRHWGRESVVGSPPFFQGDRQLSYLVVPPGVAALRQTGFTASEDVSQCCRGLTECTGRIFSKPLV